MAVKLNSILEKLFINSITQTRHLALVVALVHVTSKHSGKNSSRTSRRKLMTLSRIKSNTTYHKTIQELCAMGVITYNPSFHPRKLTEIELLDA